VTSRQHSADFLAEVFLDEALYPPGDPERRVATPQTVAELSLDDVKHWFAAAYRPDLTTIAIVGDVSPERARAAVERTFGTWQASGPTPNVDASPVPDNVAANVHVPANGRMQSSVSLVQTLGFGRNNPDYAALRVANAALSGGFSSVLFDDLRERTGYVYSVDSSVDAGKARATFTVTYGSAPQNVARADRLIAADLQRAQREAFGLQRLQEAKAMLVGTIKRRSYAGIAHALLDAASLGLPLDQDYIDARNALAATPQHVRAAMAKWIRPAGFVRVVEGPKLPSPPG
jgi:zinc protease